MKTAPVVLCILSLCLYLQSIHAQCRKYSAPVKLGQSWNKVRTTMGVPSYSNDTMDVYKHKGFIVYYNGAKKVNEIAFSWFVGPVHFEGEVFGIRLKDTFPKCVRLWGSNYVKKPAEPEFYMVTWKYKGKTIEAEIWAQPGYDEDYDGEYEADTVKRIAVRKP